MSAEGCVVPAGVGLEVAAAAAARAAVMEAAVPLTTTAAAVAEVGGCPFFFLPRTLGRELATKSRSFIVSAAGIGCHGRPPRVFVAPIGRFGYCASQGGVGLCNYTHRHGDI